MFSAPWQRERAPGHLLSTGTDQQPLACARSAWKRPVDGTLQNCSCPWLLSGHLPSLAAVSQSRFPGSFQIALLQENHQNLQGVDTAMREAAAQHQLCLLYEIK